MPTAKWELEQAAERGSLLLDEQSGAEPPWYAPEVIDLDTLDLESPRYCVLGQLGHYEDLHYDSARQAGTVFPDRFVGAAMLAVAESLGVYDEGAYYGFAIDYMTSLSIAEGYRVLTEAWRAEIIRRRNGE